MEALSIFIPFSTVHFGLEHDFPFIYSSCTKPFPLVSFPFSAKSSHHTQEGKKSAAGNCPAENAVARLQ
jgi:hypothetical protein